MNKDIQAFNQTQDDGRRAICELLAKEIDLGLPEAESKIWHGAPVWFLDGNPLQGMIHLKTVLGCCSGVASHLMSQGSRMRVALKPLKLVIQMLAK